jgi:hypothetical protein
LNFTATGGSRQVELSWIAPTSTGGSNITSYEVSRDSGSSWVTAASNTAHTFTGLDCDTSYSFSVRAVNIIGNSTAASMSESTYGHNFAGWVVTTHPSFTAAGVETDTCTLCSTTATRPIPRLTLKSVAAVSEYLATQTLEPVPLPVEIDLGNMLAGSGWTQLLAALHTAGKYVDLDLSASQSSVSFTTGTGITGATVPNGMHRIVSIVLPNTTVSIPDNAFRFLTNLTNVTIPNSVTSIGNSAFGGCSGLTSIEVDANNQHFASQNGVLYNKAMTTLIQAPPAGISGHFVIPNSVTSIGNSAFEGCTGLTTITIPNSVTSIGYSAFESCTGLTNIIIPNGVTFIGLQAFLGCTGLTSVTIGNSVMSIGMNAFRGCTGLTNIVIPDSVRSIGQSAFSDCTGLTSVTIGNSVTSIGDSAFANTGIWNNTPNNSIVYADKWAVAVRGSISGSLTLRADTVGIGNRAFISCTGLTSIVIPDSVTSIGNDAFRGCTGLTNIVIPDSVTSIGAWAFQGCTNLTTVTLRRFTAPNTITTLESINAFTNTHADLVIMVPAAGVNAYRAAVNWSNAALVNRIVADE